MDCCGGGAAQGPGQQGMHPSLMRRHTKKLCAGSEEERRGALSELPHHTREMFLWVLHFSRGLDLLQTSGYWVPLCNLLPEWKVCFLTLDLGIVIFPSSCTWESLSHCGCVRFNMCTITSAHWSTSNAPSWILLIKEGPDESVGLKSERLLTKWFLLHPEVISQI